MTRDSLTILLLTALLCLVAVAELVPLARAQTSARAICVPSSHLAYAPDAVPQWMNRQLALGRDDFTTLRNPYGIEDLLCAW